MSDPTDDEHRLTTEQVQTLAMAIGIELDEARAAALVAQAAPHFALLRRLEAFATDVGEPAPAFRLDAWRRVSDA